MTCRDWCYLLDIILPVTVGLMLLAGIIAGALTKIYPVLFFCVALTLICILALCIQCGRSSFLQQNELQYQERRIPVIPYPLPPTTILSTSPALPPLLYSHQFTSSPRDFNNNNNNNNQEQQQVVRIHGNGMLF